jgi:hypothetical protein
MIHFFVMNEAVKLMIGNENSDKKSPVGGGLGINEISLCSFLEQFRRRRPDERGNVPVYHSR